MKCPAIHVEGAILAGGIADRPAEGGLRGQRPANLGLDGAVRDEIGRARADVHEAGRTYQGRPERLKETDGGTLETCNQRIVPLAAQAAIPALRRHHVGMDAAVLKAGGWDAEVDLAHDFYDVDYLPENDNVRFTISPAARCDIPQRLLKLNHERYEEEIAVGLHERKTRKRLKNNCRIARRGAVTGE